VVVEEGLKTKVPAGAERGRKAEKEKKRKKDGTFTLLRPNSPPSPAHHGYQAT
jgi:hypothetical protein